MLVQHAIDTTSRVHEAGEGTGGEGGRVVKKKSRRSGVLSRGTSPVRRHSPGYIYLSLQLAKPSLHTAGVGRRKWLSSSVPAGA